MKSYTKPTESSQAQQRAKHVPDTTRPWIPAGKTTTTSIQDPFGARDSLQSRTHNQFAQSSSEHHEARLLQRGSLESSLYNLNPLAAGQYSTHSSIRNNHGQPELALGQKSANADRSRIYVSLDSPGMALDRSDTRMDRVQVGKQYRANYAKQQIEKGETGFIPGTVHIDVNLKKAREVAQNTVPQSGGGLSKQARRARDQEADVHKYKSSFGILSPSFDQLAGPQQQSSIKLAVGSRKGRETLQQVLDPATVVHPSELRTKTEQMTNRRDTVKNAAWEDRHRFNQTLPRPFGKKQ